MSLGELIVHIITERPGHDTVLPLYTATFGETDIWRYIGGGGI